MKLIDFDDGVTLTLEGILENRLALLCGAGLSMASPSQLPSAWNLAAAAKTKYDARYAGVRPPLPAGIEDQAAFFYDRHELGSVYLREYVDVHAFASEPNKGHTAVADLTLANALRAAVTTNVDVLIEAAGQRLFGQIQTVIDGQQVAAAPVGTVPLLKIHGCWIIDRPNTVWTANQLFDDPVEGRISRSKAWLQTALADKDLLIVGYSTDWDYLNAVLDVTLGAAFPARVIIVNPSDLPEFEAKAPELTALATRATKGGWYVRTSGDVFLDSLREQFSKAFLRQVLAKGTASFTAFAGSAPDPAWLEAPDETNDALWLMRRDLLGCRPQAPADEPAPPDESALGFLLLRLRAAGAVSEGQYWRVGGRSVRVVRAANTFLHEIEQQFVRETAPVIAPDIIVAVGAEDLGLPASVARAPTGTITRGGGPRWVTRRQMEDELA